MPRGRRGVKKRKRGAKRTYCGVPKMWGENERKLAGRRRPIRVRDTGTKCACATTDIEHTRQNVVPTPGRAREKARTDLEKNKESQTNLERSRRAFLLALHAFAAQQNFFFFGLLGGKRLIAGKRRVAAAREGRKECIHRSPYQVATKVSPWKSGVNREGHAP